MPDPNPTVRGYCPACRGESLFLGDGGYVTCRRLECRDPEAAGRLLEDRKPLARPTTTTWGWEDWNYGGLMLNDGTVQGEFWTYPRCTHPTREAALEFKARLDQWCRIGYLPNGKPILKRLVRIVTTRTIEASYRAGKEVTDA